jgi:hypothetical protein
MITDDDTESSDDYYENKDLYGRSPSEDNISPSFLINY